VEFTMTSTAQRLLEATSSLPEPLLAEVLDFAEFLQSRQNSKLKADADTPLAALCGGLSGSSTFAGSPSGIQVRLRDEWL
jgi:Protein of unknown function (DUF2281)